MSRPRAICFDMGYTLLRHSPTGPELYHRLLRENGVDVEFGRLQEAHGPAREFYVRATREGRDFEASMAQAIEFWTEYNLMILRNLGVPAGRHAELAEVIYTGAWRPEAWEIFPDTIDCLEEMRSRGIRMAVVSNFVDTLEAVCRLNGIDGYFDTIISSVDAGAMKPDSRIFVRAVRRLGVEPHEAWHVGDNYWADVLGARAAGLTPVFLDRDGLVPRPDCAAVSTLADLPRLIDELPARAGEVAA